MGMFGTVHPTRRNAESYATQGEEVREYVLSAEVRNERNGEWLDKYGACKVCDGEIPHGHTPNCDIYKLESEIQRLKSFHATDMRVTNESADFHMKECERLRQRVNELEKKVKANFQ